MLDMLAAKYGMSPAQAAAAEGRVQGLAQAYWCRIRAG